MASGLNIVDTPLSDLYFSDFNINVLQDGIRYGVYVNSGEEYVIDRQSKNELLIVMQSIYSDHSTNKNDDIVGQVKSLNTLVLNFCVSRVVNEIDGFRKYSRDASSLPVPLENGIASSAKGKGERSLENTKNFF